jgi:hypothetical protein
MALYLYFRIKNKVKLYLLYFSGKHFIWAKNHFGEAEKNFRTILRKIFGEKKCIFPKL